MKSVEILIQGKRHTRKKTRAKSLTKKIIRSFQKYRWSISSEDSNPVLKLENEYIEEHI